MRGTCLYTFCQMGRPCPTPKPARAPPLFWCTAGPQTAPSSAISLLQLAKSHRVYTLTLRGHPGSEAGEAPLTIETLADDIAHFFETLDLKNAYALGWSMGAMALWARRAADQRTSRRGIIVEDMSPRLVNDATWEHGIASGYSADDVRRHRERDRSRLARLRLALRAAHVCRLYARCLPRARSLGCRRNG